MCWRYLILGKVKIVGIARSLAAAALAVSLSVAAGCSDDDAKADGEPSSSATSPASSPSASASPTPDEPTIPELPEAANGSGDKAARAFAKYWLKMVNYAQSTGDTAPLESLHTTQCSACKDGVAAVEKAWANGKSLEGGEYRIVRLFSVRSSEEIVHIVELRTRYSKQKRLAKSGKVIGATGRGPAAFRLYLRKDGGSWVVGALEGKQ